MGGAVRPFCPFSRRGNGWGTAHWGASCLAVSFALALAPALLTTPASALTAAGTVITNVATATYDGGSVTSNTATFTVAQIAGIQVAPSTGAAAGLLGATVYYPVTVTNTGNGADTVALAAASVAGWPVAIYRDDNGDGLHQGTEVTIIADTGSLPAGGQAACFVAVTVPGAAVGTDSETLTATSRFDPTRSATATYLTTASVPPPVADFTASATSGPAPLTVNFTDRSTGSPTSWSWSFGDGQSSTTRNPTHVYANAGSYTVSLTATNAGGQNTATKSGYITVAVPAPVADFSASPASGPAPLAVNFTDRSTGSPTSWSWSFGDGQSSTTRNPTHVYASVGTYTVSLTASNAGGQNTATKSGCITVSVPAPVADFTASPTSGPAPLAVNFTDHSTGSPTSWSWSFGDGQSSTAQNPSHVYAAPGAYTVTLTVANDAGDNTQTKAGYITVSPAAPVAEFAASPTSGPAPLSVQFLDLSTGNPTSWLWDFGDGQSSTDQNPAHLYQMPGTYTVTLSIGTGSGPASRTKPVYIAAGFTDVPVDFWAYEEIMVCLSEGIVKGYPDGTFRPNTEIARDAVAVYLARALAEGDANVPAGPDVASFGDVPTSYWAYKYIEYAKALNITLGYPDGLFHPTNLVTRADMAVFLARALVDPTGEDGLKSYISPTTPTFTDVSLDNQWSWCYKHVEYLAAHGVVAGYPDQTYRPAGSVTRDQLAVYLVRAFGIT